MKKKESPYPKSTFNYKPIQRAQNELWASEIEWLNNKSRFNRHKYMESLEKYLRIYKEFNKENL